MTWLAWCAVLIVGWAGFYKPGSAAPPAATGQPSPQPVACRPALGTQVLALAGCLQELPATGGLRHERVWLLNDQDQAQSVVLHLGVPDALALRVSRQDASGRETLVDQDLTARFADRPLLQPQWQLPLTLTPGPHRIDLDYSLHVNGRLQLQLMDPATAQRQNTLEHLMHGMVLGIMLTLLTVVFVYRFVGGPRAYLAYAALVFSEMLLVSQTSGYGFAYMWPESPGWNQAAPSVFALLCLASHALFAMHFLRVRERYPRLYIAHLGGLILMACTLPWINRPQIEAMLMAWASAYGVLALITATLALRDRLPGARLYLLGSACLVLFGFALFLLGILGLNPLPGVNFFHYPKFGLLLECSFFSVALVNQVLQAQRHQAEARVRRMAEADELLRAETERRSALQHAQRQGLQLASASHDISQPLGALRLAIGALKSQPEADGIAQHLHRSLDYAESLLRGIIEETRDSLPEPPERIELGSLLATLVRDHRQQAQARDLDLRYVDNRIDIDASATVLRRILGNLISNALRYTPAKGRVLLGVRRRPGGIEIQVLDTGPGLLPADVQALQAPFRQGRHGAAEGHGLGLFIVRSLCDRSGYELRVRSRLRQGSCFGIFVPEGAMQGLPHSP